MKDRKVKICYKKNCVIRHGILGRPKGSKDNNKFQSQLASFTNNWNQISIGSARPKPPEVTFPLNILLDGTEMFCIPSKDYVISEMQIGDNYVVVRRKK